MPLPSELLYEYADRLLQVAAVAVAEDSIGGAIEYQAVWPGLPAFDCAPAIHVNWGQLGVGPTLPGTPPLVDLQRVTVTGQVNLEGFAITVLRCGCGLTTEGSKTFFPTPDELKACSKVAFSDAWAVWNRLKNEHRNGALFQTPSRRQEFALDPMIPLRMEGGTFGTILNVRVQIPGYNADATAAAKAAGP